jgi:hypothetical protein
MLPPVRTPPSASSARCTRLFSPVPLKRFSSCQNLRQVGRRAGRPAGRSAGRSAGLTGARPTRRAPGKGAVQVPGSGPTDAAPLSAPEPAHLALGQLGAEPRVVLGLLRSRHARRPLGRGGLRQLGGRGLRVLHRAGRLPGAAEAAQLRVAAPQGGDIAAAVQRAPGGWDAARHCRAAPGVVGPARRQMPHLLELGAGCRRCAGSGRRSRGFARQAGRERVGYSPAACSLQPLVALGRAVERAGWAVEWIARYRADDAGGRRRRTGRFEHPAPPSGPTPAACLHAPAEPTAMQVDARERPSGGRGVVSIPVRALSTVPRSHPAWRPKTRHARSAADTRRHTADRQLLAGDISQRKAPLRQPRMSLAARALCGRGCSSSAPAAPGLRPRHCGAPRRSGVACRRWQGVVVAQAQIGPQPPSAPRQRKPEWVRWGGCGLTGGAH